MSAWKRVTEDRYDEMLGVLPPAFMGNHGFLVGEAYSHRICRITNKIAPTFQAFVRYGDFLECSEPLTVAEFKAIDAKSLHLAA